MDLETRIDGMMSQPTVVQQVCAGRTEADLQPLLASFHIPSGTPSEREAASEICGRLLCRVEDTLDELCATRVAIDQQLKRCRKNSPRQQLLRKRQEENEQELEQFRKRQEALYRMGRMLDPAQWPEE